MVRALRKIKGDSRLGFSFLSWLEESLNTSHVIFQFLTFERV